MSPRFSHKVKSLEQQIIIKNEDRPNPKLTIVKESICINKISLLWKYTKKILDLWLRISDVTYDIFSLFFCETSK